MMAGVNGSYDVIVAGAGHNSLVCAAYVARAGLRVLVLERAAHIGGDTATEELTLPGFRHDACASAHVLIQASPILRDNELGLDRYGLEYLFPDPAVVMPFRDGRSITMFRDVDATVREIARYSERDAAAYRRLLGDWDAIKAQQNRARYSPPTAPSAAIAGLEATTAGLEAVRWRYSSALETVRERFAEEHVRAFFLWLSLMTMAWIDQPGTGLLPLSIASGRQAFSWTTPRGGSIALPNALAAIVRERGGDVRTNAEVTRVLAEGGRAVGVATADGAEHRASRAVVSTIHPQHLPSVVGRDRLGEPFVDALARWRTGVTMFVTHYALDTAPLYRLEQGPTAAVACGIVETADELLDALAAFRRGEAHVDRPPLLCISSTVVDASRAPAGRHTLKLVGFQPYDLRAGPSGGVAGPSGGVAGPSGRAEGPARWDAIKDDVSEANLEHYLGYTTNLTRKNVLGRHVESPLDLERRNPHNWRGSCHGGDQDLAQEGALRPMPGWSGYRLPVPGLYQTGSTTHPGASVTGAPGRNCARVLLEDLGLSLEQAIEARAAVVA